MSLLPVGISGEAQYQISRSLRFNSADSAYLNRTPASAGNRKTWTWSGWVKRSALGVVSTLFGQGTGTLANGYGALRFYNGSSDVFEFFASPDGGTSSIVWVSTPVYRDVSAWYHIVAVLDTTQATGSNRFKLYVNGVEQVGTFSTTPTQNADIQINRAAAHQIGVANANALSGYFNGYLTEINFIDGQALTPSSFGETDTVTGVWKPKKYTGTYGTNGFYLNFSDNSGTTSTTLGKDSSGNGNNWTPNNFSVTAGAGNDSLVDTPTNYGTDTGVGGEVRGNYATWNPLDRGTGSTTSITNGNLDYSNSSGTTNQVRGTMSLPVGGKTYIEFTASSAGTNLAPQLWALIGASSTLATNTNGAIVLAYVNANSGGSFASYYLNGTLQTLVTFSGVVSVGVGSTLQIAFDQTTGKLWFGVNNTWFNSSGGTTGNPSAGTNQTFTISTSENWFPGLANSGGSYSGSLNCGQRPFAYTAPSGFKALCTQNLPEPTIKQGDDYFNTVLYSGNSSTQSITGVGFQPDLVWAKSRSNAANHRLFDSVRGASKILYSSLTNAEATDASGLTSFDATGFSIGSTQVNDSGQTYVAWNWKANGAGSSNTAGTITSTVSVNTTSGFSIVTYTGNGSAGATVGHGLGVAPSMVITKCRSSVADWMIYHASQSSGYLRFDTAALTTSNAPLVYGNGSIVVAPSSTVITYGSNVTQVNANTATYVAYCFAPVAGYSAFGSYTGNGSADGPFVYTGFRPKFIMQKKTSATGEWVIWDTSRSPYNFAGPFLYANSSAAESASAEYLDILSNGFKWRTTNSTLNQSGATSIFMAFAENPFKYSLAR